MDQWHVTLTSSHRRAFFPLEQTLRMAVLTLDRVVGSIVLLFCIVDDHIHLWIVAPAERVRFVAGLLRRSLGPLADAPIDVVHCKPVETRTHQMNLVSYLLDQLGHHGIDAAPASWTGACYQDLIGARLLDGFRPRLRRHLPRLNRADIDRAVGIAPGSLREATEEDVRRAGPAELMDAAARSLALGPELVGRTLPMTAARRAACTIATAAGIRQVDFGEAIGLPCRTIRRLLSEPAAPELLKAVRLQVALGAVRRPPAKI